MEFVLSDTAMIFALTLASNLDACKHLNWALEQLRTQGVLIAVSYAYEMQCRDAMGANYINAACLLKVKALGLESLKTFIRDLEERTGRIRPSHQITLDIDLIAWKHHEVQDWQLNIQKMPFTLDVKVPLYDILPIKAFYNSEKRKYKQLKYEYGGYYE